MDAITNSTARANLAGVMNRVCEDHEALIITRNGDQSVVMLSLRDYKASGGNRLFAAHTDQRPPLAGLYRST
jgi:prevent-host-death family protein